jgi:hypothetical protein
LSADGQTGIVNYSTHWKTANEVERSISSQHILTYSLCPVDLSPVLAVHLSPMIEVVIIPLKSTTLSTLPFDDSAWKYLFEVE